MNRKLSNWIDSYLTYTTDTESAPIFNKWVAISTIASALQKKTWLRVGRLKIYPNLYIVLVANPGIARKSQAIAYASELISEIPSIVTSADSGSAQGLMEALVESATTDIVNDSVIHHASLSVISREFESFLSNIGGSKMLVTLTDLYDAGEQPWKHRTQKLGTLVIPSVYLNILGATTPESLGSTLSSLVFGGGLASRITFVCSNQKAKKVPFPELTPEIQKLKEDLEYDLREISHCRGEFTFSEDAKEFWENWYMEYDEVSKLRQQPRNEFNGWYSRKPTLLQKLSVVNSASRGQDRLVQVEDIKTALQWVSEVEVSMGVIFNELVPNAFNKKTNLLESTVREYQQISEKHLLQLVWREMDQNQFDQFIEPLLKERVIKRVFTSPDGNEAIWYHWLGKES